MSKYRDSFYNVSVSEINPSVIQKQVQVLNNQISDIKQSALNEVDIIFQQKAYALQVASEDTSKMSAYEALKAKRRQQLDGAQVIATVKKLIADAIDQTQSQYNSLLEWTAQQLELKVDKTTKVNSYTLDQDVDLDYQDIGLDTISSEQTENLDWNKGE